MPFTTSGLFATPYCIRFLAPADIYNLLGAMANDDPGAEINTIEWLMNQGFLNHMFWS